MLSSKDSTDSILICSGTIMSSLRSKDGSTKSDSKGIAVRLFADLLLLTFKHKGSISIAARGLTFLMGKKEDLGLDVAVSTGTEESKKAGGTNDLSAATC